MVAQVFETMGSEAMQTKGQRLFLNLLYLSPGSGGDGPVGWRREE